MSENLENQNGEISNETKSEKPQISKEKKTFWPYGIVLSILACIVACIATIVISLDYPVHMDNFYFEKYQKVDKNYNEIQISQANFDKKYSVNLENIGVLAENDFLIKITITPKNSENLQNLKAEGLLTRPETNKLDQKLDFSLKNGEFISQTINLKNPGRWQVMAKISDGSDTGFFKFEFLVAKK